MKLSPAQLTLVGTGALGTILERAPPAAAEWLLDMVRHLSRMLIRARSLP